LLQLHDAIRFREAAYSNALDAIQVRNNQAAGDWVTQGKLAQAYIDKLMQYLDDQAVVPNPIREGEGAIGTAPAWEASMSSSNDVCRRTTEDMAPSGWDEWSQAVEFSNNAECADNEAVTAIETKEASDAAPENLRTFWRADDGTPREGVYKICIIELVNKDNNDANKDIEEGNNDDDEEEDREQDEVAVVVAETEDREGVTAAWGFSCSSSDKVDSSKSYEPSDAASDTPDMPAWAATKQTERARGSLFAGRFRRQRKRLQPFSFAG
jgi:hypothetical protein